MKKTTARHETDHKLKSKIKDAQETIKKQKNLITQLDRENYQLKNLIDNLPGDIYWKDRNSIWFGVNKRGAESLQQMGFISDRTDVIGKSDFELFNKETAEEFRKNDLEVMNRKIEITREEINQLPNGTTIIQLSTKKPLWDKNGNVVGVVGTTLDISYLKKIEHELTTAIKQAEAANYIMTEFIANMGHDLATPISDVGSIAEILNCYADEYPDLKDLFETLKNRCADCENVRKRIINSTSLSNLEVNNESFSIIQELVDIEKELRPLINQKSLKMIIHPFKPKKKDVIETDRVKFHAILFELISNAIQFTDVGGVTISVLKQNDHFTIQVADTGIGIPADKFDYIFEHYTKLARSNKYGAIFKGVGAGLYLARLRANILNARISVESEVNKGSIFSFSIPAYPIVDNFY